MTSRRLLLILALGVSAVIIAVLVLTLTPPADKTTAPTPATTATVAAPAPVTPYRAPTVDLFGNRLDIPPDPAGQALPQDSATRPDPGRADYLTAAPAGLQWQSGWGGAALPVSRSDGPEHVRDGIASGFANTPQGAALAACDAIARAVVAPDGIWQAVVRERYLGGGQTLLDRFARSRHTTPDAGRYVTVPDGIRVLPGYRPDFAVVQIAVRADDGWAYSTWPMAYSDGDWRVRVPDDVGALWQPGTRVPALSGFGQWKESK
ncbi:hypothetical protein [Nocardia mexicana]|uniref:DUF8175 domain-containing protein n=1 Tax=Nocardia mexicana TaxID=279262 RepID=A0A370GIF4_9NOCA|nr:hypothetical protein [Nocardia mexicana]RDI43588.1 hypothetical protein DFR68_12055 [Nocardia mexicana]